MGEIRTNRRTSLIVPVDLQRRIQIAVSLLPAIGLAVCGAGIALSCDALLTEALAAKPALPSLLPMFVAFGAYVLVSVAVVVRQATLFSNRIAGPVWRLVRSMQRVREGDLTFRVTLRRGDHLEELVVEFNRLIEWLNENPPPGAKTGSDLVDVEDAHVDTDDEPHADAVDRSDLASVGGRP
jgi:methyl-accepting chemotaxis protein